MITHNSNCDDFSKEVVFPLCVIEGEAHTIMKPKQPPPSFQAWTVWYSEYCEQLIGRFNPCTGDVLPSRFTCSSGGRRFDHGNNNNNNQHDHDDGGGSRTVTASTWMGALEHSKSSFEEFLRLDRVFSRARTTTGSSSIPRRRRRRAPPPRDETRSTNNDDDDYDDDDDSLTCSSYTVAKADLDLFATTIRDKPSFDTACSDGKSSYAMSSYSGNRRGRGNKVDDDGRDRRPTTSNNVFPASSSYYLSSWHRFRREKFPTAAAAGDDDETSTKSVSVVPSSKFYLSPVSSVDVDLDVDVDLVVDEKPEVCRGAAGREECHRPTNPEAAALDGRIVHADTIIMIKEGLLLHQPVRFVRE